MTDFYVQFSLSVSEAPVFVRASIALGGCSYLFDPAEGEDQGDYHDPGGQFVQRSILCTHPGLPAFRAYYRPDVGGEREEWVFELGDPFASAPANMPGYAVEITRADGGVVTVSPPAHFWLARWRWQSEPRPVRRTVAEMTADGLLPLYDPSVLGRFCGTLAAKTYTPMGLAGVYANMANTGERPDIGIITGWQADYACVGANLGTILAQAEAAGTINMHVRTADAPIDLFAYPKANMYSAQVGAPFILRTPCVVDGVGINYDTGHSPTLAYLPYLLTGDPYFLEELQFQANMDVVVTPPSSRWRQNGRYLAWSLRNCLYATVSTPAAVPCWLQTRAYFQRHLDMYRAWLETVMTRGDPLHLLASGGSQSSPSWPAGSYFAAWQEDFTAAVFAIAVRLGFTEWRPEFLWKLDCTLQRTHGAAWPRSNPAPYQVSLQYACALAAQCDADCTSITVDAAGVGPWPALPFSVRIQSEDVRVTDMAHPVWTVERTKTVSHTAGQGVFGPTFGSWEECAARNLGVHPEIFPTMPGNPAALYSGKSSSVTYPSYTRGALALAVSLGAHEAEAPFAWLDGEFRRLTSASWHLDRKWAFGPG